MNVEKSVTLNSDEMWLVVASLLYTAHATANLPRRAELIATAEKIKTQVRQRIQESN